MSVETVFVYMREGEDSSGMDSHVQDTSGIQGVGEHVPWETREKERENYCFGEERLTGEVQ